MAYLGHEHVATIDSDLVSRARSANERRRPRTVNQIDHNRIVTHRLELERRLIRIAPNRRRIDDDVITPRIKIAQGKVRQSKQRRGMLASLRAAIDQGHTSARLNQCRSNRASGAATTDHGSPLLFDLNTMSDTGSIDHIGIGSVSNPPAVISDENVSSFSLPRHFTDLLSSYHRDLFVWRSDSHSIDR